MDTTNTLMVRVVVLKEEDGYVYQFRQIGDGTYDVCTGLIQVDFEVSYQSGGNWAYWYTSNNKITI